MKEKIKVSKEEFQKNLYIGFCSYCIYFNDETEKCEIENRARKITKAEGEMLEYQQSDIDKMECVLWDYKYTT